MSFVASISVDKHKLVWSKTILALSLISEELRFVIDPQNLKISAINPTGTNNGEVSFESSFFQDYHLDFDGCVKEGYDETSDKYSFVVNSHHLSILFKNIDTDSLISLKVKFNQTFKLLIDIKRHLVVKKYQINYHPIKNTEDAIAEDYKSIYAQEEEDRKHRIRQDTSLTAAVKYIMIEQNILKNFIDMIPLQTEEFRIEVKNNKIMFNGFTQEVLKDNQYLKQPMSITISLSLEELMHTNLTSEVDQFINFKLKFFKIFVNLITFVKVNKLDNFNDFFEMYYKSPGDPIVFELTNIPHMKITFIQLTNDEGSTDSMGSITTSTTKPMLKSYQLEPINRVSQANSMHSLRVSDSSLTSRMNTMVPSNQNHSSINSPEIDQLNINFDSEQESEFGPTQMDEVKSIFD